MYMHMYMYMYVHMQALVHMSEYIHSENEEFTFRLFKRAFWKGA